MDAAGEGLKLPPSNCVIGGKKPLAKTAKPL